MPAVAVAAAAAVESRRRPWRAPVSPPCPACPRRGPSPSLRRLSGPAGGRCAAPRPIAATFSLPPAIATIRPVRGLGERRRQRAGGQRRRQQPALAVEEVAEQLADPARRRRSSSISPGSIMPEETSCACGSTVPMPTSLRLGVVGHLEDLAHAALLQQHLAVLGRVGEERHRHDIGLRRRSARRGGASRRRDWRHSCG